MAEVAAFAEIVGVPAECEHAGSKIMGLGDLGCDEFLRFFLEGT